ncbi:chorismate-binding protein [Desulfovibrio ferrophilus]|nr:chorismate-binding protein [Desulfovibrio ferrophilus]
MRYNHSVSLSVQAFTALAYRLAQDGQADLFLSGSGRSDETRCVIGFIPRSELIITDRTTRQDIKDYCFGTQEPTLGFISYTYGLKLRGVKTTKTTDFPLGHLKQYGAVLEHDLSTGRGEIHGPDENAARKLAALATAQLDMPPLFASSPAKQVQQSLTQEAYESGVRKTLEAIRDGHTYQLNLSLKFSRTAKDMDMPGLAMDFWQRHPAPFYAFFNSGTHTILSTSPERFLRVTDGEVLSQPIKGTLHFKQYTPELEHKVTSSAKESAELSMIVDLVRNDISQNCEYGSVRVEGHKSTFIVDNLVQMYSNVHGRLREDSTVIDLLLDAFPGGSITGCPKRRSMELIETLEPHTRDVYCGSFVIIRGKRDMDSSIAIRTCWHDSRTDTFSFHAGSGIVVDSAPRKEYRETMAKAHKFLALGKS